MSYGGPERHVLVRLADGSCVVGKLDEPALLKVDSTVYGQVSTHASLKYASRALKRLRAGERCTPSRNRGPR